MKVILKDAFIEVDGTDLSDHFSKIEVNSEKDVHDTTGFGAVNKEKATGLGDAKITGTVNQDFEAGSVDATLWPLHEADVPFPVVVRHKSGPVAADNPQYTMQAILPSFSPIAGQVGEPSTTDITFENASQDGLQRTVA